jgi:hypothetical protein
MYVQPLDGSLTPSSLASPTEGAQAESALFAGSAAPASGDNISRFVPPWLNQSDAASPYGDGYGSSGSMQGVFGSLMGVLQQLMQMLQSMMGYGSTSPYGSNSCPPYGSTPCPPNGSTPCPPNGSAPCPPNGKEQYFQNARGSSDGDPHLSFNGAKWNNMASQPDLINSDSIAGGFRVSTQVTPRNAQGVTWNQSATVALNNGATTVTMNNNGEASISSYGQSIAIAKGQTVQLGDGESVTYDQNGALRVSAQNGAGGKIETTLTADQKGVDVDVTAHDVDLGGALVHGYDQREPNPNPTPAPGPYVGPTPTPMPYSGPVPAPIPFAQPIPPMPFPPNGTGPEPIY